ncbi:NAD(P)H-dependent flavin oxidoreductase [Paracoccus saliphilus]|uniref:Propionate 3-nitronate monooxygenase n=1 Tax=Paracoccus saliphilus TaxID=405559 RepID=A0AA45W7L2_9RHOB|nr:nitronate monooxygenase [Paracoccus saliphilus]WCR03069.1 nitronate monooxygenase [Paracoccus saliphilus]SIT10417.1 nitronate monooxygenase [Paracoccus saliphilus]
MLDRLELRHPLIQAPMAGVSTPELAAAVSEAGALGSVALGALDTARAQDAISRTRALTGRPFAVNLFCHRPAHRDHAREMAWLERLRPEFRRFDSTPPDHLTEIYQSFRANPAMLDMLVEARPAAISFHFGLPEPDQLQALRATGAVLLATATSEAEGRAIADAGLDGIVAQGWQAGGHRGSFDPELGDEQLETLPLTRQLTGLGLPVIAAGGIMTREDARQAIQAGAIAVQCGTAFLLAPEAATSAAHHAALSSGKTVMTRAISGRPARGMENLFTAIDGTDAADYPVAYDAGKALNAAALAAGETGYGAFWAGTGAASAIARPAAETVAAISL